MEGRQSSPRNGRLTTYYLIFSGKVEGAIGLDMMRKCINTDSKKNVKLDESRPT